MGAGTRALKAPEPLDWSHSQTLGYFPLGLTNQCSDPQATPRNTPCSRPEASLLRCVESVLPEPLVWGD